MLFFTSLPLLSLLTDHPPLYLALPRPAPLHSQLHDEHHLDATLEHVLQGHDVGVLQRLQDLHLALHAPSLQAQAAAGAPPQLQELARPADV